MATTSLAPDGQVATATDHDVTGVDPLRASAGLVGGSSGDGGIRGFGLRRTLGRGVAEDHLGIGDGGSIVSGAGSAAPLTALLNAGISPAFVEPPPEQATEMRYTYGGSNATSSSPSQLPPWQTHTRPGSGGGPAPSQHVSGYINSSINHSTPRPSAGILANVSGGPTTTAARTLSAPGTPVLAASALPPSTISSHPPPLPPTTQQQQSQQQASAIKLLSARIHIAPTTPNTPASSTTPNNSHGTNGLLNTHGVAAGVGGTSPPPPTTTSIWYRQPNFRRRSKIIHRAAAAASGAAVANNGGPTTPDSTPSPFARSPHQSSSTPFPAFPRSAGRPTHGRPPSSYAQPPPSLTPPTTANPAIAPTTPSSNSSSTPSVGATAATTAASSTTEPSTTTTSSTADMDGPYSFWGPDLMPLPSRFARMKANLIAGHEAAIATSWSRLITALRAEVDHIEGLGAHLIPSIEFTDIEDPAQTSRFGHDLKRYGVGVVRGVVPKPHADLTVRDTVKYLEKNYGSRPPPLPQDPTCFDYFWTPAQVCTRAHPSVMRAQRFMMNLWETTADDRLALRYPIAYADRLRVHGPGILSAPQPTAAPSSSEEEPSHLRPSPNTPRLPSPGQPLKSADDWLSALQASGVIAQVDNGSLERWEPDGYQRGGTYDRIFSGNWEAYDPWECTGRVSASSDLYNGYGACSVFRMFQGLVALSTIEPGMIRLLPSPRLATAYFLLRPFFSPRTPPPAVREGPAWEAFLAPENWVLDAEPNSIIHGAVPGHAQRVTELWHPHLHLRRSLITLPTLQSGDYILWHPDLAYHITSNGSGAGGGLGAGGPGGLGRPDDVSMLVYVPATPLTQPNALYLARQRKAFQRGHPGPDFDSIGMGVESEAPPSIRLTERDIAETGGPAALQAMGLAPWESAESPPSGGAGDVKAGGRTRRDGDDDVVMDSTGDTKSMTSTASRAEAEVVRLANIILFPDRSMLGYS